jgi:DNA polymerase-3 subunit gamma/tau
MGYDLRAVCRELSRVVRDVLVLSVDPSRISDPEIAGEGERDRLKALAGRFSREDLLRAFDLLTKAEQDIKSAAQPRYHLEMALLRWIHLRKLMPIEDLIAGAGAGPGPSRTLPDRTPPPVARSSPPPSVGRPSPPAAQTRPSPPAAAVSLTAAAARAAANVAAVPQPKSASVASRSEPARPESAERVEGRAVPPAAGGSFKDAFIAEIKKSKAVFYNMVVAQAQTIEVSGDRMTFSFTPGQRALKDQFEQQKPWLESLAQTIAGRRIAMASSQSDPAAMPAAAGAPPEQAAADQRSAEKKSALREQALADAGVQTMLEVFPAEIRDVEEM